MGVLASPLVDFFWWRPATAENPSARLGTEVGKIYDESRMLLCRNNTKGKATQLLNMHTMV